MGSVRVKLNAVGIIVTADMSCKFDDGNLHTKTKSELWNLMFAGIFCCGNHAFHTTGTKTTGNNDTSHAA